MDQQQAEALAKARPLRDRKDYMREFMRKKRLKARAAQAPAEPCDDRALWELSSKEQDQVLRLVLQLLVGVDQKHRKKFYKHFAPVAEAYDGIYISTCSMGGWANGGYAVDAPVLALACRILNKSVRIRTDASRCEPTTSCSCEQRYGGVD
jgi:hypothetical protein